MKKNYENVKHNSGITLIALVITIIIILILAAIIIRATMNGGILDYAKNATNYWDNAAKQEANIGVGPIDEYMEKIFNSSEKDEEILYESGIWIAKKSKSKLPMVKIELYSKYSIMDLNEYKENCIVKILNKIR